MPRRDKGKPCKLPGFLAVVLLISGLVSCGGGSRQGEHVVGNVRPSAPSKCNTGKLAADFICAHEAVRRAPPSQPKPNPPLPALTWNQELADLARAHADKCAFEHSSDAARKKAIGAWVGENIAANTGAAYTPEMVVNGWAGEAADYKYQNNSCRKGKMCGHYTQVVWRETTQVGCAKATCGKLKNTAMTDAELWVCNYLPGGNYVGERPY